MREFISDFWVVLLGMVLFITLLTAIGYATKQNELDKCIKIVQSIGLDVKTSTKECRAMGLSKAKRFSGMTLEEVVPN